MNLYRTRRLLWLAAATLAVLAVAIAAACLAWPLHVGAAAGGGRPGPSDSVGPQPDQGPPLEHYGVVWQRDLRRPVFDAPPVATKPAPRPQFTARLVGTALEPGFTYAVFATGDGKTVMRRVGQEIEGAEVKAIAEGSVTLLFAGETLTLRSQKKEGP